MTFYESLKQYKWHFAFLIVLLAGLYHSIVFAMIGQWYNDPNYSHGFLVPVIAGYFVYQKRDLLSKTHISPSNTGFLVIVFGLSMLIVAFLATEYFTMRSSLIFVLSGIVLCMFGKDVFGLLLIPICYLFFMIPLPEIIYNAVAFPLKLLVARYSVDILDLMGVIVLREGNIIMFPTITLEVADACSGLRSLMSLLAVSAALSLIISASAIRKVLIILSAIPIAILTNAVRVIVTGLLAQYWGARVAEGFFHEFAGMLVFGLAVAMLIFTGILLRRRK